MFGVTHDLHAVVTKHTTVKTIYSTGNLVHTDNQSCGIPPVKAHNRCLVLFICKGTGSVVPITWRSKSIPNTGKHLACYCSENSFQQPPSAALCGADQPSHNSDLKVASGEGAAALAHVRNDPHLPTHSITHPFTESRRPPPKCTNHHVLLQL